MTRLAVFGYASLVSRTSAAATLGREVERVWPASLPGWRRRFSQARDNHRCEKTFARAGDGWVPDHVLALNIERSEVIAEAPNGALIEVTAEELLRLDRREIRYDRLDVTGGIDGGDAEFDQVHAYVAKPANHAPAAPAGAVILAAYARAVEEAFTTLGPGELDRYRLTTGREPVPRMEATLLADQIVEGNPRAW